MNARTITIAAAVLVATTAANATITWTDWTSATSGSVTGNAGGVTVTWTGGFDFAQTSGGTNYWEPASTYTSAGVPNAPGSTDIIGLSTVGGTLSFSQPVTNPVLAIVSLGQPGLSTEWVFVNRPITRLSSGPGFWGNGPLTRVSATVLEGREGHGTIQLMGTFSSVDLLIRNGESWAGFTVGIPSPGAAALLGLAALSATRRRR
jgi:hypothetical protein